MHLFCYILRDSLRVSVRIKWLSLVIIAPSTFLVRLVILESTFQYDWTQTTDMKRTGQRMGRYGWNYEKISQKSHFPSETWNKLNTAWMDNTTFGTLTEAHQHASIPQRRKPPGISMLACAALQQQSWVALELQLHTILVEATSWRLLGNIATAASLTIIVAFIGEKFYDTRCRIFSNLAHCLLHHAQAAGWNQP